MAPAIWIVVAAQGGEVAASELMPPFAVLIYAGEDLRVFGLLFIVQDFADAGPTLLANRLDLILVLPIGSVSLVQDVVKLLGLFRREVEFPRESRDGMLRRTGRRIRPRGDTSSSPIHPEVRSNRAGKNAAEENQ